MTALIIGGSGFLGNELIRQARAAGHTTAATYATRPGDTSQAEWYALDLRDAGRLDAVMAEVRPHLVVDASSGKADWATTTEGPVRIAMAAAKCGSRLVQVSSDAVFSGARVHYDETCLPDPITPYGAAKAAAETGVLVVHPEAVVARTSLIIGYGRSVHERLVHELAAGTHNGALFTDDIRCPVHVADLAAALWPRSRRRGGYWCPSPRWWRCSRAGPARGWAARTPCGRRLWSLGRTSSARTRSVRRTWTTVHPRSTRVRSTNCA
ncbi:sugar nucleotide-binding protein (plasmid) [Streptomyces sp. NBC_00984]|uniref:sugar nucleotide-binding protein n=1 Tax=Streptomyces sp. NBC_00984 TaxID=2903700 RepID=UPI002F919CA4|nr:sugar nucleotide-binding protein [Streptomyces sp. NBC_00984]